MLGFDLQLFSWEATLLLAALGWLTAGMLMLTGRSSKYVMLPAYFALMEVGAAAGFPTHQLCLASSSSTGERAQALCQAEVSPAAVWPVGEGRPSSCYCSA